MKVYTVLKYTKNIHRFNYCSYLIYLSSCSSLNFKNDTWGLYKLRKVNLKVVKPTEIFFRCTCNEKILSIYSEKISYLENRFFTVKTVNLTFQANIPPLPLKMVNIRVVTLISPVLFLSVLENPFYLLFSQ